MTTPMDLNNANNPSQPLALSREGGMALGVPAPDHLLAGPGGPHDSGPPPILSSTPNALGLLQALQRRWLLALVLGVLVAAPVGTATWFLLPPARYTARVPIKVAIVKPHTLFDPERSPLEPGSYLHNQAYLIRSSFVLNAALRQPGVAELAIIKAQTNPVLWLEGQVNVEFPGPEYMSITLTGEQPEEMLTLVKAVAQAYLDEVDSDGKRTHGEEIRKLEDVYAEYEAKARRRREELRNKEGEVGPLTPESMVLQQRIAYEDLRVAQRDLGEKKAELRSVRIDLGLQAVPVEDMWPEYAATLSCPPASHSPMNLAFAALVRHIPLYAPETPYTPETSSRSTQLEASAVEVYIGRDVTLSGYQKDIAELRGAIGRMRSEIPKDSPRGQKILAEQQRELAELEKKAAARRAELLPEAKEAVRGEAHGRWRTNRAELRYRLALLTALVERLKLDAEGYEKVVNKVNKNTVDLYKDREELALHEVIMKKAQDRIAAMQVEVKAPARIKPFGDPSVSAPEPLKRKMTATAGAAGLSFAFVLLGMAWLEFRPRKVHSPDEVVQGLGMQLVGTVPDLSQRPALRWLWPRQIDPTYTQSLLTESVDAIRTLVLHTARAEPLQVVMIASAAPGEGKTSLASHLAASLARAGRRTLLLDSDLRNPTLHHLFDLRRGPGLSELLRGQSDLGGVIRETAIPNLWLISAGHSDPCTPGALAREGIGEFFKQLRQQYDFIVVDSCPVLPVVDALLVGQYADAVIFSLLRGVSRLPRFYAAYRRLALLGIRILGVVINGTHEDSYGAGYYNSEPESEPVSTEE